MAIDCLLVQDHNVVFRNAAGVETAMPNLSKLVALYDETTDEAVKARIKEILSEPFGKLLVVEIMMDMTNERTLERLQTGEISKTMRHVHTYNVILDSHRDEARDAFEKAKAEGQVEGEFEATFFAPFPYGMVIEEAKFPNYQNTRYENQL